MTGLEKIIQQILSDAEEKANISVEHATKKAQEIKEGAEKVAEETKTKYSNQSVTEMSAYEDRMMSAADLKRRTALLKTKQEIIEDILQKAHQQICQIGDTEYIEIIKKMLNKYASAKDGEVYFSEKDLKRFPASFDNEIQSIAKEKGGALSLAKEPKNIDGGFILVYGGMEENCSFSAIFEAEKSSLQDKVQQILFK